LPNAPLAEDPATRNAAEATYTGRDDSDSECDIESEIGASMIPKPQGEVGRPGRGGYNLQDALEWDKDLFYRVRVTFILIDNRYSHSLTL